MSLSKNALFVFLLTIGTSASAQFIDTSVDRVKTPLSVNLKEVGSIKPRNTTEIESSRITVGCETLDRDLAVWDNYKAYLRPLGVKKIRLQAGWAKCEKVAGVYDWKWLDEIIDYAVANGMEPWLETSYGNPIYVGGGGKGLINSMMTTPEGYAAWDRWVEALVKRYKNRVKEYEIWNEPDHFNQKIEPEVTARLNLRTAKVIKKFQPEAKIAGGAFMSHSNVEYMDRFLKVIADDKKLNLFQWISYHSYSMRPEASYSNTHVFALRKVLEKYSKTILLRQGENGAPSTHIPSFALSNYYWTEYTQAKYDLRRLLGDLGHDIETSVFTIIDIYYKPVLNTKGLIQSDTTMAAIRPKVAYYAVQNLASIFDNNLILNQGLKFTANTKQSMSVFGYQHKKGGQQLVTLWLDGKEATNSFSTTPIKLTLPNTSFISPVWVDLLTGKIYEIQQNQWRKEGQACIFDIPVYDSPVLIAEKSLVMP